MEQTGPAEYVVATYEEIRLRFGLGGTDQARIKAKRRKWVAEPVNHPGAVTRIRVPRDAWDAAAAEIERARSRGSAPLDPDQSHTNKALIDAVAAFREAQERSGEREERFRTERDAALAELGEIRTRAAVAEAKLEAAEAALAEAEMARIRADRAEGEVDGLKTSAEHMHEELARMRREVAEAHNRAVTAEQEAREAISGREGAEVALAKARSWNFLNFLFGREGKGRKP